MIKIELKNNFNLDSTVTCGQIFRYYKLEDNSYDIILKDRVINVYKKDNYLIASSNNEDDLEIVVRNYFDLDNDYENINKYLLEKDSLLKDAIMFSCGLMMIRQDPFETLIEYIISANNGVPNITSALNNIAKKYGKKVLFNKKEYYLFPSYKDLKDVTKEDFRECKVGFRDKYLESIIYKLNNNIINLDDFNKLDSNEAMDKLMENNGIGPKVASCILLFAYQRYDVFPVDTWVKKIMESNYDIIGEKNIREFASKTYGKYSALAIQYLFNYSRNKSN
mgnify:FL=1